jgi:prepilin-type N-terminal cleavage/methylation domain-containing protein/prepilin-type processing-associated H-X9-DG protein
MSRELAKRLFPGMARWRSGRGFTLIELLVVVGVIAVLIAILVPSLGSARSQARKTACKALLRSYALATDIYAEEFNGTLIDAYTYLDPDRGLARYWSGGQKLSEKLTRCPDDSSSVGMGRAGPVFVNTAVNAAGGVDWSSPALQPLNMYCSIGGNENALSASGRRTSAGYSPMWVRKTHFVSFAPQKIGLWADWQNNPVDPQPAKIFWTPGSSPGVPTSINSVVFRHRGAANVAYADGHVGEMKALFPLAQNGHDFGSTAVPFPANPSSYYPFGPRNNGGSRTVLGDLPGVDFW